MTDPTPREAVRAVMVRLREVRTSRRWSLATVEEKSGGVWPASSVGAYERGGRTPSLEQLLGMADWYGIPRDELIFGGTSSAAAVAAAKARTVAFHQAEIDRLEATS